MRLIMSKVLCTPLISTTNILRTFSNIKNTPNVTKFGNDLDLIFENPIKTKMFPLNIDDYVNILRNENAKDILVIKSKQDSYLDYICIVTGTSLKHMQHLIFSIRKAYKNNRNDCDLIPKVEGGNCKNWIALDMGNIAFHVFSEEARLYYDIDTLWSVGREFDEKSNDRDVL